MATPMEKARAYLNAAKLMMQAILIMKDINDHDSATAIKELGDILVERGFKEIKNAASE